MIQRLGSDPPGPFEDAVGYARVVRAGPHVWVSGCTSVDAGGVVRGETPGEQMALAIDSLVRALERVGASAADVVRTRLYVTDASRWEEVGRAHGAVFGDVRPATAMIEVHGLIDPRMLVEIEADAYVVPATGQDPAAA
ncbi:MAG TPA: RidA family protein [Baekduia sp.]|nr:RidA family protein [Baekduia sp.]